MQSHLQLQVAHAVPAGKPQGTGSYTEPARLLDDFQVLLSEKPKGRWPRKLYRAGNREG